MKTILITGASTGIGYATAHLLKQEGWQVFASCRKQEDVTRLQNEGLECFYLDLSNTQSVQDGFKLLMTKTPHLDAVFCNAGYGQPGAVEDIPRTALQAQFETNVFGTWETITQAMRIFRQQGHGRILVNSSVLGFAAMPWRGAYNSSKFALEGMCDTLRNEIHDSDIFVSLIEPGPISTQFRANALIQFKANIDMDKSVHHAAYQAQLRRLSDENDSTPFTLSAHECAKVCLRALLAKQPKARYSVTFPTHLFHILKRLLPVALFDRALRGAVIGQGKTP